ncbi:MAG TPA: S8 family serine peptidase [Methylomirabilota bacterium]|jgi:ribosomal protein L18|nr:S8 family serine peptidase [Methylomirabilota bacterium]
MGVALVLAALVFAPGVRAADSLTWRTDQDRVSADIKSTRLFKVLEEIARTTGWHIFVEPDTARTVSAKFKELPPGEALRLLLGDLNYALVPETNGVPRLYVFRTNRRNATQVIDPAKEAEMRAHAKLIPNELIVRLKPGAKIDELARALGAKVIGRIDSLNAYRLQFDNEDAATAARAQLADNGDVSSVDNNYSIDRPLTPREALAANVPPPRLQLRPPPADGRIVIGLVDTAVQPLGNNLDGFLLKQLTAVDSAALDTSGPSHGTSMAETMLRSLEMMTKGSSSVQILPVDVYGSGATTSTFDVASGVMLAVNGGATIINMSLGSDGDSSFLHDIIKEASAHNIVFIGAAGNTPVTTPFYPAAYPEVMAVTAIDRGGQIAPYANRGSFVTMGAPGTSVIYYNGQPWYVMGTSPAAAFTSGVVAGYADANRVPVTQAGSFARTALAFTPGAPAK